MYIVTIHNGDVETPIHNHREKLESGKVVKGINTIDSFTFSMFPNNPGFSICNEFTTLVRVYNTNRNRYDFIGRVLYAETTMSESGLITKTVTCENILGYLCDSVQAYVVEQNWTVAGLLQHLIDCHNSQTEEYKHFILGNVTAADSNDNLYQGIQREKTWNAIKTKLIDKIGGELQARVEEDGIYLDYLEHIGEEKQTEIALSVNMKSITREQDPTSFVTRLIPLGCKLTETVENTDEEGNVTTETVETENRLDITSVNNGLNYIDDEQAVAVYGVHVGVVEWDDVTEAGNLLSKGEAWLEKNNRVQVKYSITALDLSLIDLSFEDFEVGNWHPVKNGLIGIDDTARIIKETIDICEEVESTIEVGDNFKTLSDIQRDQAEQLRAAATNAARIGQQTSARLDSFKTTLDALSKQYGDLGESFYTLFEQFADSMSLSVNGSLGSKASIVLSAGTNEYTGELDLSQIRRAFADDPTAISISAGTVTFNAGTLVINSTNFRVTSYGVITATSGTIGAITLCSSGIYSHNANYSRSYAGWYRPETILTTSNCFFAGASDQNGTNAKFLVTYGGALKATDAEISGVIITESGAYKAQLDSGGLELYYNDTLCGTINTKYWSGAATEGISLRVEEGGKYIMFSHADDTQGSGYVVDYYLNGGWSSNYDEMHIFQTSARFLDDVYFAGYTRIRSLRLFGSDGEYLVGINSSGGLSISKL